MSVTAQPRTMTGDEFVAQYGHRRDVELIDGQVVEVPMPEGPHGYIANNAAHFLTLVVKAGDLGRVFNCDTFVRTRTDPDRYRGADVCYVSYARMAKDRPIPKGPLVSPPDLVVEVKSPSDRPGQVSAKALEYIAAGVAVVLVLDPETESVAVFRMDEFPQRLHNGDELTLPDVLPGFAVPVKAFFA